MTLPYSGVPNQFRLDLIARKRLIGCWCSLANPISTEVLGVAGFDGLLLGAEHSPNDVTTLIPQLMAWIASLSGPAICRLRSASSASPTTPTCRP